MINRQTVFLVVDDFEPMRAVTAGQLRSMGAKTILTADNGAEALRMLRDRQVDIVLSDWNMPVMTGLELLKAVRADERLSRLPFIMITADIDRHRIEDAITSGVSDLLVKPYTEASLTSHVKKVLATQLRSSLPVRSASAVTHTVTEPPVPTLLEISVDLANQDTQAQVRSTILVVDDMSANLLLLSHFLEGEYRVLIADNGEKALKICQSNDPPDMVLLDIVMPGMDGFEVAKRMREHPTSEAIPVIFVTSLTDQNAHLKGLELGAVDFVTKPIDFNLLKPRVRNFMRHVKLHKQLQASYDDMLELARLREDVKHITRHDMKGPLCNLPAIPEHGMCHKEEDDFRIEHFDSEEDIKLHIKSKTEILSILQNIAKHGSHVALYYGKSQNIIMTTLLGANEQIMWLDAGPFPYKNKQLLLNNKITFVCVHQHVKIQFVANEIKNDLFENNEALYLKLPDHLLRVQRRAFFRIVIPHTSPIKCIIPIHPENLGEAVILREIPIVDISRGGIRLLCEIDEITLLPNTTFPNCQIKLPGVGLMTVTIEVRNVISFTSHDNVTHKHIGCRFIHLGNQTAMLQDYIARLEFKTLVLV